MICQHTVTRGREGQKGSWCEACGVKVLEVHDRPCRECEHYRPDGERVGICRKMLMRVTANMNVTYWLVEGPGRNGLCFSAADEQSSRGGK